jgi:hypothetical protein
MYYVGFPSYGLHLKELKLRRSLGIRTKDCFRNDNVGCMDSAFGMSLLKVEQMAL